MCARWSILVLAAAVAGCAGTEPSTIDSVALSPADTAMLLGEVSQLRRAAFDASGTPQANAQFDWTSSSTGVATVDTGGIVSAAGVGTATITASAGGHAGHTNVSVTSISFSAITAGGAHTCGLAAGGVTWCWGRAEKAQLGPTQPNNVCLIDENTHEDLPCLRRPIQVTGAPAFAQIVAAERSTCGLTSDGSAWCWGWNNAGQLGDGSGSGVFTTVRATPAPVATTVKFSSLAGSGMTYCGVSTTGATYCWGNNGQGQLGNGQASTPVGSPIAVVGNLAFRTVTVGPEFACGITTTDDAWCWGGNTFGELGIGQPDNSPHGSPLLVSGGHKWSRIDGSFGYHVCGVDLAGAAWCWGSNTIGQLGDGTLNDRAVPTAVAGGLTFTDIVAGGFSTIQEHSCAITAAGKAYCWGDDEVGALGDGGSTTQKAPVAVSGNLVFSRLTAGFRHTCGIATANVVYCWGSGRVGQVGATGADYFRTPTKVIGQP